ncbi:type VI secretion system lipoprotein TssJ [Jannaschia seohaensis]|uniref:Type VI secretion system protein VasD n=1 Tax=Jannaschia seohaensis TaxID=475081 RepID=A0A2Y9C1Y8_9RHOB|nr:type VI secretion system lipoprotein TssJ [Jannaschia seohaensis]PWJ16555.1 type VI secretion system protein VasD [Jannaschia seohaensis]SSA48792.1 type VI secretion system protein VasD [Jannaschia seohaensis]
MIVLTRRGFVAATGATALVAACTPAAPNILTVNAQGLPGMNPSGGSDVPVTVHVLQLRSPGAFEAADYIALQSDPNVVGADLVRADRLVLAPGGTAGLQMVIQPDTSTIGVTAGFRDPSGRTVRRTIPAPTESSSLTISVGPSGLSLA